MIDPIQVPQSLNDLENVIRAIEKESKQPSQLIVIVGNDRYLIGDLRKRAGEYHLEMYDEYHPDVFEERKVANPHKRLAGVFPSFDELKKTVAKTQEQPGKRAFYWGVYIVGGPEHGYSVGVPAGSMGSAGGEIYSPVGKIVFPLLQDGEKVSIDKINR